MTLTVIERCSHRGETRCGPLEGIEGGVYQIFAIFVEWVSVPPAVPVLASSRQKLIAHICADIMGWQH
jgi:hypothetical protein